MATRCAFAFFSLNKPLRLVRLASRASGGLRFSCTRLGTGIHPSLRAGPALGVRASSMTSNITGSASQAHTNRLAKEESPYLLQHAHNPVDWYPWGQEAFEKAKREDKPIFLSVGYSTCHWCHVMERESFESEEVANIMNEKFVNVKVDREERPDVDRVYMMFVQAMTGGGGWPMSVFLTPELEPIVGGTYFPPNDAYGRPGFKTVLNKVAAAWLSQKSELKEQGTHILESIGEATSFQETGGSGEFQPEQALQAINKAYEQLSKAFDAEHGGFSRAPKFPRVSEINLVLLKSLIAKGSGSNSEAGLVRAWGAAETAVSMAELTLKNMAAGGIYDHIGGGFARYSVDEWWHVPHFEKMLYDNPQIVQTYLDAFRITGKTEYAKVVRGVLDYLMRDMRHPEGGFYSAEDADSLEDEANEKKEGAFYVWEAAEIDEVLGAGTEEAALFKQFYNIKSEGNATLSVISDPHGEFKGKNVPIALHPLEEDIDRKQAVLASARKQLFDRRAKRPRPHLDDKIVTAWNGLAIGALAAASQTLQKEDPPVPPIFPIEGRQPQEYLEAAVQAAEFLRAKLWDPHTKRLKRSYRSGPSDVPGFDTDYAFLISGLLDLYGATADTQWLAWAKELQTSMDALFWDSDNGGYFSTTGDDPSIKLRLKEDQDGAEPAASSVAVANLLRLAAISAPEEAAEFSTRAAKTAAAFSQRLEDFPVAFTQMCCSLFLLVAGHLRQVVIAGKTGAPDTAALLAAAHAVFCPDKVTIVVDVDNADHVAFWEKQNPSVLEMAKGSQSKTATAFVCQNFTCQAPTPDAAKMTAMLSDPSKSGASRVRPAS